MTSLLSSLQSLLIFAIPVLFAITVHEVAHGWLANKLGDPTARMLGRLTLNPIKHIDPVGTIIVPAMAFYLGGFLFGWAKPVPVNWHNLRSPRRDMALVAAVGPMSNLLMAVIWAFVIKTLVWGWGDSIELGVGVTGALLQMAIVGIQINALLMLLNLLPIPPLDGSRVVRSVLPTSWTRYYDSLEPFGFFILLALLALGALGKLLGPLAQELMTGLLHLLGL